MKIFSKGRFLLNGLVLLTILSIYDIPAEGQPALLPVPQKVRWTSEKFYFIGNDPFSDPRFKQATVSALESVQVNLNEAYRIIVQTDSVIIQATGKEGFFRAKATLDQLMGRDINGQYITGCSITDWPAFRIRGFMHDCGRSFIPIDELKREVQILSLFKINTFHWHLTEDIAWRLQSDIVPALTSDSSALRDNKSGFYSRAEVKEFISFCNDHFIQVIPEIDMPGHSASFTRATGFTMQSEQGKKIVKEILNEACQLFDGQYFHIGTDEVKLTDPDFVEEMMAVVRSHGKEVIGWLPGASMDEGAIRQLWADVALPPNTVVIDSRYRYFNHTDVYSDLFAVYNSRLCDSESGSAFLAGGICSFWNDRKPKAAEDILVSNGLYPMMLAFAERSWLGGGDDIKTRGVRMGLAGDPVFERFRNFERRMLDIKNRYLKDLPFPYLAQCSINWRISDQLPNNGDLEYSASFENAFISNPFDSTASPVRFLPEAGASVYLRHTWGAKIPAFYSSPVPEHTTYVYTWVFSPETREAGLNFSAHNYGRSETDASPPAGKWDYKSSKVWFNGQAVNPPEWENPGRKPDLETPYSDENYWDRLPVRISLKEGWNSLVIKLPAGQFSTPETRLVKWMFTAMIVTPDGRSQPEGLVYSPERIFPGYLHPDIQGAAMKACPADQAVTGNHADLCLPDAWGDNMVLQHDRHIRLSGQADSDEQVFVSVAGRHYSAKTSSAGKWEMELEPLKAGGPYELSVKTRMDSVVFRNILAGEVWLCSGQSNMEWSVSNSDGWEETMDSSKDDHLRIINFRRRPLPWTEPWDSTTLKEINNLDYFEKGEWSAASPETIRDFSGVAYYFGRRLRKELDMPVGLIEMAVGGSPAEAWIERQALESHSQLADLLDDYRKSEFQDKWVKDVIEVTLKMSENQRQRHPFEPSYLFEAGITNLIGFPVRGVIWYQGESNAGYPELYEVILPELVRNWRTSWNDTLQLFYYAQLSGIDRPSWPAFRESQRKLGCNIPHSGMIVTADIGHPTDVHPRNKMSVGERFAFLALNDTYGKKKFNRSPEPVNAVRRDDKVILTFRYARRLRTSDELPVRELEISEGVDYFSPADVSINRNQIIIESAGAVSVRYGWKPYSEGNLIGETGLPVPTFKLMIN